MEVLYILWLLASQVTGVDVLVLFASSRCALVHGVTGARWVSKGLLAEWGIAHLRRVAGSGESDTSGEELYAATRKRWADKAAA